MSCICLVEVGRLYLTVYAAASKISHTLGTCVMWTPNVNQQWTLTPRFTNLNRYKGGMLGMKRVLMS